MENRVARRLIAALRKMVAWRQEPEFIYLTAEDRRALIRDGLIAADASEIGGLELREVSGTAPSRVYSRAGTAIQLPLRMA